MSSTLMPASGSVGESIVPVAKPRYLASLKPLSLPAGLECLARHWKVLKTLILNVEAREG